MERGGTILLTTILTLGFAAAPAMSTTICGLAQSGQATPVAGVRITAKDSSGNILGEAETGNKGEYQIDNLGKGTVDLFLDPGSVVAACEEAREY